MFEIEELNNFIKNSKNEFEEKLAALIELPSISMDPERKSDIFNCASLASELLKALGAEVEIFQTKGNPIVFGKFIANKKNPSVGIYNHLDVQPANEPQWQQEPFKISIKDDIYFGRGTTDDKGPALTLLLAAKFAIENDFPLNFYFIYEFEEEIGSPNFSYFLNSKISELKKIDSFLISDTEWISKDKPSITYGLRGILALKLILETAKKDVHSGTAGGAARNPLGELCQLIANCYDAKTGLVKIPNFYRNVRKASTKEINYLAKSFDLNYFKTVNELKSLRCKSKIEVVKKIYSEPTFEVHGIVGGYTGEGIKTIVPPKTEAKITMRLVPNQKPEEIFSLVKKFVLKQNKDVKVEYLASAYPYLVEPSAQLNQFAHEAIKFGFGKEAIFIRCGGSIGAVSDIWRILKKPIILLGLSWPENNYHGPNENFSWLQASGGIKAFVKYFELIAKKAKI